jgi:hypothetical protein
MFYLLQNVPGVGSMLCATIFAEADDSPSSPEEDYSKTPIINYAQS